MTPTCPFCEPARDRIFHEDPLVIALWDGFPVSPGHALIVPRRHVPTWFDANAEEQAAILRTIDRVRQEVLRRYQPDGFNIGINVREAAGQTVFHLHLHVIPRYRGDVPNPRGGVRRVIPHRADYLATPPPGLDLVSIPPHTRPLIRGDADPLLPHLRSDLDRAIGADLAISFILRSGLRLIGEHLRDLLRRGGRLRILTGDYLDVTEPEALRELRDLEGDLTLRVFEARSTSFHPKAFIFRFPDGSGTAYVGSSNLTASALNKGVEWNYRVVNSGDPAGFTEVQAAFEALFQHPAARPVDDAWIQTYEARRGVLRLEDSFSGVAAPPPDPPPVPHAIQLEALAKLEATRRAGNTAGLIVLATGLGKTWLSAFDSNRPEYRRILFVAHRQEILSQAIGTFRRIRPKATLGRYDGQNSDHSADIVFASILTLGRSRHLERFRPETFDYIVVDEFHHAAARTYRNLLNHFRPKFLLGLTATPERMDGGDLLALCQENLVFRCDAFDGIDRALLCPFQYFGVPDDVDYAQIPWRNARFDEEALTQAVATRKRAQNALEQYRKRGGKRTLAFCVSQRHADFMADYFRGAGVRAVAVHAGAESAPRAASLEQLSAGGIDVIFAVDMFNEGVDVPTIDTVLMLRPTESGVIWQQQFGRGLRVAEGKSHLRVIDYIGNHRIFLTKIRTLLRLNAGDYEVDRALNLLAAGAFKLPPGCEVTYELEAIEIIKSLLRARTPDALRAFYEDFRERHGMRPTATETFHEKYFPGSVRPQFGSWFGFVAAMQDLSPAEANAAGEFQSFLKEMEVTCMTKSFKMLTLQAMLNLNRFPGDIDIDTLRSEFRRLAKRSAELTRDVGAALDDDRALRRLLEMDPINAWTGVRGAQGQKFFGYENGKFSSAFAVPPEMRTPLQELTRELVEWRLAQYLSRAQADQPPDEGPVRLLCKVSHSGSAPILFLPDRRKHPATPTGWTNVETSEGTFEANFVKVAVNVLRRPPRQENVLPEVLRQWFGPAAGMPGTRQLVAFEQTETGWRMSPAAAPASADKPELWREYDRPEIPELFGLQFNTGSWNQGFVVKDRDVFLLVTLDKDDLQEGHKYRDRFLSPTLFEWQSQNRTRRDSAHGELLRDHVKKGVAVHLFVRRSKKRSGRPVGFTYCGEVQFVDWEGDEPITIRWRLAQSLPDRLKHSFKVGEV